MPYKRPPTDDEVEALAAELRPLWRKDDAVRPWLRNHADMLVALVHDDWSWDGLAAALGRAGITYRTGHPWRGEQLRTQVAIARQRLKYATGAVAKNSDPPQRGNGEETGIFGNSPPVNNAELHIPASGRRPDRHPQQDAAIQNLLPGHIAEPRFKPAVAKPYAPPVQLTAEERAEIDENRKRILGY